MWRHYLPPFRCSSIWLRVCAAVLLLAVLLSADVFPAAATPGSGPFLRVAAPGHVAIGEPIALGFTVVNVSDIAGYEVNLLFDTRAAEWSGLRQRENDVKKAGRDVSPLGAVELPQGAAFGLYSCPTGNCVERTGARMRQGVRGSVELAQAALIARQPGALEIKIDAAKFVDADGTPLSVALPPQTIVVQVDAAGTGTAHPAPSSPWSLGSADATIARNPDVTGDGNVTHADATEVALAWTISRERGAPCAANIDASRDINGDGCIDVSDLQIVAANYSLPTAGGRMGTVAHSHTEPASPLLNLFGGVAEAAPAQQAGTTFTVNSELDNSDSAIGDGVCTTILSVCTLRAAIQEANAQPGPNSIAFAIPGGGVRTIKLDDRLPALSDESGPTTIDGYTQPGTRPNSDALVSNAALMVQIEGQGDTQFNGLVITSARNVVRGLALYRLHRAFWIYGSAASDNRIDGNFIGTDAGGVYESLTVNYSAVGIRLEQGAARNHIGDTARADRNVISGNPSHGIAFYGEQTDQNLVRNNLIGLSPLGDRRLQNRKHGIDINNGPSANVIGGTGTGERNVISGNGDGDPADYTAGIEISHGINTVQNRLIGNCIGTDATCNSAPAWAYNSHYGIRVEDGVSSNVIANNVIGNSRHGGIRIDNFFTTGNQVTSNRIGVSANGTPIPNEVFGVMVTYHAIANRIGPDNIIAYNPIGVWVQGETALRTTITRNTIFGNSALGIDLDPSGGVTPNDQDDSDAGPNDNLNFPVLAAATPQEVSGTACANCTVEIFIAEPLMSDRGAGFFGQGKTFVGAGNADTNGQFRIALRGVKIGDTLTATATDAAGNSSEFSRNLLVPDPNAPPTPTPTTAPIVTPTPTPSTTPTPSGHPSHASGIIYIPLIQRR